MELKVNKSNFESVQGKALEPRIAGALTIDLKKIEIGDKTRKAIRAEVKKIADRYELSMSFCWNFFQAITIKEAHNG